MKHASRVLTAALMLGLSAFGTQSQVSAESAKDFYKGKTITALSGYGADSTLTQFSRMTARYLEKYTGAKIAVQPMPAAGGTVMRNHLMEVKPDGLTVVLCGHGPKLVANAMFDRPGVRYDWKKFEPIGKAILVSGIVVVAEDSPWKKPRDPGDAHFLYGESSPFFGPLMAEALGWKNMKFVPGYHGNDKIVAIKRGEIQTAMVGADAIKANPGLVRPLVAGGFEPAFPHLPTALSDAAPGGKKWGEYINNWNDIMFMAYGPPGMPKDRVAFLESAMKKVWADPGFRKAVKKVGSEVMPNFVTAADLEKTMKTLAALSPADVKEMKHVILTKYKKK
jgi:tripartite-type tricarboxylate transporter receptor subunit TctC